MNYRHIYHAGNFADVFKHLVTSMVIEYLQQKDKSLFMLDAFAGTGLYNLSSTEAQQTLEYGSGIESVMNTDFINPDLQKYRSFIEPFWKSRLYPGSPLWLAKALRAQDRLVANELHPKDAEKLEAELSIYHQARVTQIDAYQSLRGNLPPQEKRGLILIDPPFERRDEFEILAVQMKEWMTRFATGVYMIWYPIKADSGEDHLFDAAYDLKINRACIFELLLRDRETPQGLNGCGMFILNTPFQIPERVEALALELSALWPGSQVKTRYLLA